MRRFVIAANWKMNKDGSNGPLLAEKVLHLALENNITSRVQLILCPPFILLDRIRQILEGSMIGLGAQNMHHEDDGAFTGEISGTMLRSAGCGYVILGHSERRMYFAETDQIINRKALKALAAGLRPIVCVGETLEQREAGITRDVVDAQIRGVLQSVDAEQLSRIIVAYEPVWAIGTGRNATPGQAQEVHSFLRGRIAEQYGDEAAGQLIIQYGGSMKAENAEELLAQPDVDGGLVGGASLNAEQFIGISGAAYRLSR